nr:hypothetical protein [Tanacetum cinerariifolium]
EFYAWNQDAQTDCSAVRAEIKEKEAVYERERETSEIRQALARSEAHNRALEAWIRVL